jgi:nitrate reductase NapE component
MESEGNMIMTIIYVAFIVWWVITVAEMGGYL